MSSVKFDVARVRGEFPILKKKINQQTLAYLDNAATTQKPQAVIESLTNYYQSYNANIHRGVHTLSQQATQSYEAARAKIARFVGANDARELVLLRGTTEAINLVAQSFVRPKLQAGDEVLISGLEHHSNIVPWQMICEASGAQLKVIPLNDRGELRLEECKRLLSPKTKFLAIAHVSNALGTVNPVGEIIKMARAHDVPVLLDGAQAVPHLRVDVKALDCDFYAFSSHKMFGPTGIGALYGKLDRLQNMPPYQGGGDMISYVTFEKTTYNEVPFKFEAGTPSIADTIAFGAAIDFLTGIDFIAALQYENDLLRYAEGALAALDGVRLIGTAAEKVGVISFVVEGVHPHDVGTILDGLGIAVRTGHHCAQPVMDHFKVPATTRASLAFYNTKEEIDRLALGLQQVKKVFRI